MTFPFEATPEMVKAALDLVWEESETHDDLVCRLWRAMATAAPNQSSAARELALEEAEHAVGATLLKHKASDYEGLNSLDAYEAGQLNGLESAQASLRALSSSPLSSPDHVADADKLVDGDRRAELERFWRPISEADKSITFEQTYDLGGGRSMTIRNSDHYWVRDADGRVYEATWSDHKAGCWWDLEGESPVDPVEYMPHPLSLPSDPASEKTKP